eukprot:CAMPEP_0182890208 /NCGR_PEP_ID=MMETSP0034_2-20130328/22517_1 /TAXON_ID=156128 /ORGANISM="Nephroselmis pyriformis, Strain CCMP717" /LENGTH=298 /DNA_ID=CAMNT_0025023743 /DNA_START=97 /DNA_END=990 /DNA_ORIENTATION=-
MEGQEPWHEAAPGALRSPDHSEHSAAALGNKRGGGQSMASERGGEERDAEALLDPSASPPSRMDAINLPPSFAAEQAGELLAEDGRMPLEFGARSLMALVSTLQNLKVGDEGGTSPSTLQSPLSLLNGTSTLNVAGYGLRILPPVFHQILHLEHINLSHNRLLELPQEIGSMGSLRTLRAPHNLLRRVPASLAALRKLEVLDLNSNKLASLGGFGRRLGAMRALRRLDLRGNMLPPGEVEAASVAIREGRALSHDSLPPPECRWEGNLPSVAEEAAEEAAGDEAEAAEGVAAGPGLEN